MEMTWRIWLLILAFGTACQEAVLTISPDSLPILNHGAQQVLTSNLDAHWSVREPGGGTISADGVYTAPDSSGVFTLEAISKTDSNNRSSLQVRVSAQAEVFNALLAGGQVIYLRHTIAKEGADLFDQGLPGWHRSCEADTARQLSLEGLTQAQDLGLAMRNLGIPLTDRVYVSEFCRCIGTADLLKLGLPLEQRPEITYYVYDENQRSAQTQGFINQLKGGDGNALLVSHSFGPGWDFQQVEQGHTAIFKPINDGFAFWTILSDQDWIVLQ